MQSMLKGQRSVNVLSSVALVLLCALAIGSAFGLARPAPLAQAQALLPEQLPAKAIPIGYSPAPNAILQIPPIKVQITFSQAIKSKFSTIVIVNASNRQVDDHDPRIESGGHTLTVTLPLLPAGTYEVLWRSQSAKDGSIASGSYVFSLATAKGTVPPHQGSLPHDSLASTDQLGQGASVSGAGILAAMLRWLGIMGLTLLLGLLFWWAVVQPRQQLSQPLAAELEHRTWRSAGIAFLLILVSTVAGALALALSTGIPSPVNSIPSVIAGTVWDSRAGHAVVVELGLAVLGALIVWLQPRLRRLGPREPRNQRLLLLTFGAVLALAFEYAGPGQPVPPWWDQLIEYLHLLADGIWLGGLLYLAVVVIPALETRSSRERQGYLAASLAKFSIPALSAAALLVVTGPLDAAPQITSPAQLWTTVYGIDLVMKSALFLGMAASTYYYLFILRPRLAALTRAAGVTRARPIGAQEAIGRRPRRLPVIGRLAHDHGDDVLSTALPAAVPSLSGGHPATLVSSGDEFSERAAELWELNQELRIGGGISPGSAAKTSDRLAQLMLRWLRVTAILGIGVLVCAALLAPLSSSVAAAAHVSPGFASAVGAQTFSSHVGGLSVTLSASPGRFGNNTFTVLVLYPDGTPVNNGRVSIETDMVEMDMGTSVIRLTPAATAGTYSGQGQIPMEGHWRLQVDLQTPQEPARAYSVTFTISAGF